jgi:hypothetical protein
MGTTVCRKSFCTIDIPILVRWNFGLVEQGNPLACTNRAGATAAAAALAGVSVSDAVLAAY